MTPSEEFVSKLCFNSFLSLWCYPNPKGKNGKELCDVLVVCDPSIIIISVKEIEFKESGDYHVDFSRWQRRAIDESVDQICGAQRWIESAFQVITKDGERALHFPSVQGRQMFRIGVAFGSKGKVPIMSGDFECGFIHIFDEISIEILLEELDTLTDFIEYLKKKENFLASNKKIVIEGGEEDLLAFYLMNDREFPPQTVTLIISNGLWREISQSPKYREKKNAEKNSYAWDQLIEQLCTYFYNDELLTGSSLEEFEKVVRVMAKEDRFSRRCLVEIFFEFMIKSQRGGRARIYPSPSGVTYVFQANSPDLDRRERKAELALRCFLARGLLKDNKTVIGIATETFIPEAEVSYDIFYCFYEEWTPELQSDFERIQEETGYFKNIEKNDKTIHEYLG